MLPHFVILCLCMCACVCVYIDIDECKLQNGGCSHTCSNSPGGHTCHCPPPLLLGTDNLTCSSMCLFTVLTSYYFDLVLPFDQENTALNCPFFWNLNASQQQGKQFFLSYYFSVCFFTVSQSLAAQMSQCMQSLLLTKNQWRAQAV